jgi:hypothetical protein
LALRQVDNKIHFDMSVGIGRLVLNVAEENIEENIKSNRHLDTHNSEYKKRNKHISEICSS